MTAVTSSGSSPGVEPIPQTLGEIQATCIHVWRDQSEVEGIVTQECIRCRKTRSLSIN